MRHLILLLWLILAGVLEGAAGWTADLLADDPLARQTLLFVDDHEILYRSGTRRQLHSPVKHPTNPLLTGSQPRNQVGYCSVFRDPSTGRYQLWYQLTGGGQVVAYAESTDGLQWTKPNLDLISIKGVAERNVVFTSPDHYGASVVVDDSGNAADSRYKMAYWSLPPLVGPPAHPKDDRGPDGGMFVAFSPDGIHWMKQPGPVLRGTYGRAQDPPLVGAHYPWGKINSVSDAIDAFYDPLRQQFVIYAKGWIDAPDGKLFWKRAIMRTDSRDFLQWTPPALVIAPDEQDGLRPAEFPGSRRGVQLHAAPVFVHHGVYFALLQVADFETHGLQPIELAISRDGLQWSRPFREAPFLPVGTTHQFDAGRIWSNATPVVLDDEIRFYYGAYEHPWKFGSGEYPWDSKTRVPKSGMGLATLPLDRFAGLKPMDRIGQITLRPRSLLGRKGLTLNANAAGGSIRVELLDATGQRIPGFTKAEAVPIATDGLRQRLSWKDADVAKLATEKVMIRIHLDNAEVFALTLE